MKTTARFEVFEGTTISPGKVLATFPANKEYSCGGPATACLRWFDSFKRRNPGVQVCFRKVS